MVRPNQLLSHNEMLRNTHHFGNESTLESIPRRGMIGGVVKDFTENDSAYGELALSHHDSSHPIALDWQTEKPVAILKNLQRLTAPNPGVMTGPGTNTYILGTARTGFIVIDPGPLEPEHTKRIYSACEGDIRMIVCTHSHPDHSPGARPLQSLCKLSSKSSPPILGLSSKSTAKPASHFVPERELVNGECLVLSSAGPQATSLETHTLQVIFTPGHAANHVCFILLEDRLLFSGDHVLNGSTTIVDPPDGNMRQYLDSLLNLARLCQELRVEFILPAHGYVLGNYFGRRRSALTIIENLYEHRMKREAKILKVVQQNPTGSMDDWVKLAYDDVPEGIWPIAKRSLLAHVENLRSLGSI